MSQIYDSFGDSDQRNFIQHQQVEALKLIQISLQKLNPIPIVQPSYDLNNNEIIKKPAKVTPVNTDTNLQKNLLIHNVINKAKYVYYQSIVQTMQLSLMSKLNYYSTVFNEMNSVSSSTERENMVEEMRLLMEQITLEAYRFNLEPMDICNEQL